MRYENQNKHSKLDVHDAAVILKAMQGESNAAGEPGGNDGMPGEIQPQPAGAAAVQTTAEPKSEPEPVEQLYKRVSEDEIGEIKAQSKNGSQYYVLIEGEIKLLRLKRGKENTAKFELDDDFIEVSYDCVYMN